MEEEHRRKIVFFDILKAALMLAKFDAGAYVKVVLVNDEIEADLILPTNQLEKTDEQKK